MGNSDIGIYGLGVMGRNLALNISEKNYRLSVFNPKLPGEEERTQNFLSGEASGLTIRGFQEEEAFVQSLQKPRKILIMVKAGDPVDSVITALSEHLESGDILVDGGNSHFKDTLRRTKKLQKANLRYVGMGVSGGEEGARYGPSLMPGGNSEAWPDLKPILESVAATSPDGSPCCRWMGGGGAGHFVKMVHNGIEYAIMQIIAECYHLMEVGLGMSNQQIAKTFSAWSEDWLDSYLLDITANIFKARDDNEQPILDSILDRAGQKGTGRWTAITALELGIPAPLITEAVYARVISSFKELREQAEQNMGMGGDAKPEAPPETMVADLRRALLAAKMVAFAEGFWLLKAAEEEYGWKIPLAGVAETWRGGCIIRSGILEPLVKAYKKDPELPHLLLYPEFQSAIQALENGWRSVTAYGVKNGFPIPAICSALSHFDGLKSGQLPANLIQAQRDYFGAHGYERKDRPAGERFHTNWRAKND